MTAAGVYAWRRRFPARALRRIGWYAASGSITVAVTWLLFGAEPDRLDSGEANPLAAVPPVSAVLVGLAALPLLLALIRRPLVAADHYALTIRPGSLRTLLLPWAEVAELAAMTVGGELLLLVRSHPSAGRLGDRPTWWDRGALRAARRFGRYHLGVRLADFIGDPEGLLAGLAALAPYPVRITAQLPDPPTDPPTEWPPAAGHR
jgi:hypothetical protein